jgi:hypothetical protein
VEEPPPPVLNDDVRVGAPLESGESPAPAESLDEEIRPMKKPAVPMATTAAIVVGEESFIVS